MRILVVDSERIRLDEIIKALFSTSNGVLLKLLNGIFDENFKEDEVEISMENKEFPKENYEAKESAKLIAYTCDELFKDKLIEGSDFHIMLLTIQNLIEYLNGKYFKNVEIEEEVKTMTKTLYDPEVEKRGKADLIIKLLVKKFQVNPEEYKEKLMDLSAETIEDIGIQLFDMNSTEDLNKYFKK